MILSVNFVFSQITSTASGNWNTGGTWVGGVVPDDTDDVIIADTHTVNVINSAGSAESITVNSGGKLRIYKTLTVDNTSSNAGTLSINESDGVLVLSAGNFTNSGTLTIAKSRQMTMADASTLTNTGSIEITSDSNEFGTLVLNGTYTGSGTVTYGRYVSGVSNNWDLIGSPVTGQDAADFISSNGDIAENSGDYGIGPYNNDTNTWTTWNTSDAISNGNLVSGKGYQMANASTGAAMEFTGGINAGSVNVSVINNDAANSGSGTRFNLVANPYPSFINANSNAGTNNFIGTNGSSGNSVLMSGAFNALYAWGGSSYTTINQSSGATYIAPGQGFMIAAESSSSANLSFTANMQTTSGSDDFISGDIMNDNRSELFINIFQNDLDRRTEIYFIENVTDGLDVGYDASVFELANNMIYSRLLTGDEGIDLSIQALAYSEMWDKVIPIGINALGGEEMTISISHRTTPADLNIYLEDTEDGTMTNLLDGDYVLTPASDINGVGRFFIHMTADTMSNEEVSTSLLNAYKEIDASYITIEGLATQSNETKISLYNILGREVLSTTLNNNMGTQTISTVGLSAGIYVIELESGSDRLTKKLLIQ